MIVDPSETNASDVTFVLCSQIVAGRFVVWLNVVSDQVLANILVALALSTFHDGSDQVLACASGGGVFRACVFSVGLVHGLSRPGERASSSRRM